MSYKLERFCVDPEVPTFGRLFGPSFSCFTLERPWLDNRPYVSCIPKGTYQLRLARYNRGGYDTLEICDVPGRSAILLHIGNVTKNTQGCVLLGDSLGVVGGRWAVLNSGPTFESFVASWEDDFGQITIE